MRIILVVDMLQYNHAASQETIIQHVRIEL